MLRLHTLGRLDLVRGEPPSIELVPVQAKRLALLAYLATASPRGFHRRDTLLALFWPELDQDEARRSLRQALYYLRNTLGDGVLVNRGDDLVGIKEGRLDCDAVAFELAVSERRSREALELYRGEFLEGFFASETAPEFEQWIERTRIALRARAAEAAAAAADDAENEGRIVEAAILARRACELSSDDEKSLRRLLSLLDRAGDRGGALRAYAEFAQRLNTEYEAQPSAETQALARSIRARSEPVVRQPVVVATELASTDRPQIEPAISQPPAVTPRSQRRTGRQLIAIGGPIVVAITAVSLYLTRPSHGAPPADGVPRLAVLPFESTGTPEGDVFADGVADEIRGKLAALDGLRVIAGASAREYRNTRKPLREIANELGVRYILTGKLQWQGDSAGVRRVRVVSELVETESGTTEWQHSYDARLWDVFQVQSQIAEHVADALGVEVKAIDRRALTTKPTASIAAYESYLRGRDMLTALRGFTGMQQAIERFRTAVRLDSTFALAWAWLAQAQLRDTRTSVGKGEDSTTRPIRLAAERALRLAPGLPDAHLALASYYGAVVLDNIKSVEQYALGLAAAPNNPDLLSGLADALLTRGEWDRSLGHLERAAEMDPRSRLALLRLHRAYLWLRRYPEALRTAERAIAVRPQQPVSHQAKVMVHLAQGDLASAHAALSTAAKQVGELQLVAFMAWNWDLYWALPESQQQLLLRSTPAEFDGDTVAYWYAMEDIHHLRGNMDRARAYAETTLARLRSEGPAASVNAQYHIKVGIAQALLGRRSDAVREGRVAVKLVPVERDSYLGAYALHQLARIETLAGERDSAVTHLEALLAVPYFVSRDWLRIDPTWAPLHANPRFERLIASR